METSNRTNNQNHFNIRVYGIVIENNHLLLADEFFKGLKMTKFPGGGLEFGEGTIDCLRREAHEELNCEIDICRHYYTTDYFQPALFFEHTQLISIYYAIKLRNPSSYPISKKPSYPLTSQQPNFRWVPIADLNVTDLTFPIDQKVAEMIIQEHL